MLCIACGEALEAGRCPHCVDACCASLYVDVDVDVDAATPCDSSTDRNCEEIQYGAVCASGLEGFAGVGDLVQILRSVRDGQLPIAKAEMQALVSLASWFASYDCAWVEIDFNPNEVELVSGTGRCTEIETDLHELTCIHACEHECS